MLERKSHTVSTLRQNVLSTQKIPRVYKKAIRTNSELSKVAGYKDNIQKSTAYQYTGHGMKN